MCIYEVYLEREYAFVKCARSVIEKYLSCVYVVCFECVSSLSMLRDCIVRDWFWSVNKSRSALVFIKFDGNDANRCRSTSN